MNKVINILYLIFICCIATSCSEIKDTLFGDDTAVQIKEAQQINNKECKKLSIEEYLEYSCVANEEVKYDSYIKALNDLTPSQCDDYNSGLEKRNEVCFYKWVAEEDAKQEALKLKQNNSARNMHSNIEYNLLCSQPDDDCYVGLINLPSSDKMVHLRNLTINFVKFNNNVITVNMTNNMPESYSVESFKDEIELRLINSANIFVKIRYSVSAFTLSDDQLGFVKLSNYNLIYPGERITLNYKLPQTPYMCSDYGLYMPSDEEAFKWYFSSTVKCTKENIVNNARTI